MQATTTNVAVVADPRGGFIVNARWAANDDHERTVFHNAVTHVADNDAELGAAIRAACNVRGYTNPFQAVTPRSS